ncbi:hypothetical protein [Fuerstiella marisgermanici]|uniref:Uncharacterized protein n=1 Tax=Fuerstiella marisgermanici TaxID=1891926 RepID=A0A1P8WNE9_9PLAN|nr:hypothetical protein [Fuerstiella marisgermanici]APZ95592.1 hypothetical protein Fuma_05251 [Fuerstiella marisgermanici]
MERRRFLQKSLKLTAGAAAATLTNASVNAGIFEKLLTGIDRTNGTLLDRIDVVLRNADKAFKGVYHGYGLGIHEIMAESKGPLPTEPKRSHPSWPHIHCVCHCNSVANLGEEEGAEISRIGGIADEVNQAYFSQLFYSTIMPMVWHDQLSKYDGPERFQNAQRDMKYLMQYAFGTERGRKKALMLAAAKDKRNRDRLQDFRHLIYGLVDALESTWQRSDFHDNYVGRQGGRQCPKGLTAAKKREWCSGWCTGHGVTTDAAEGYRTTRPWGPFHPLFPGPVPTMNDVLHGDSQADYQPELNVAPPEMEPIVMPKLKGMYKLRGPRAVGR